MSGDLTSLLDLQNIVNGNYSNRQEPRRRQPKAKAAPVAPAAAASSSSSAVSVVAPPQPSPPLVPGAPGAHDRQQLVHIAAADAPPRRAQYEQRSPALMQFAQQVRSRKCVERKLEASEAKKAEAAGCD